MILKLIVRVLLVYEVFALENKIIFLLLEEVSYFRIGVLVLLVPTEFFEISITRKVYEFSV